MRGLAADLISEIRQLDRRIAKAAADIQTGVTGNARYHYLSNAYAEIDLTTVRPLFDCGRIDFGLIKRSLRLRVGSIGQARWEDRSRRPIVSAVGVRSQAS
jgi:hypothetical protein